MIDDLHRQLADALRTVDLRHYLHFSRVLAHDVRLALAAYDRAVAAEYAAREQATEKLTGGER